MSMINLFSLESSAFFATLCILLDDVLNTLAPIAYILIELEQKENMYGFA